MTFKLFICGLVLAICTVFYLGTRTYDVRPQALQWAADMGYPEAHVSCQQADTDHNGKISCDALLFEGADLVPLDCTYVGVFPPYTAECTLRPMVVVPRSTRRK